MSRTVFISGKITGLARNSVKEKLGVIDRHLKSAGFQTKKPAIALGDSLAEDSAKNDIKTMLECDELHLASDWQNCTQAMLQRDIALRLGMQVVYH